ncbi:MAG TPA: 4-phosphopantoate--beta-alanine ligase [Methanoregulaceae archaeon]|nr:MAG: phosphopantothenate/pantothenate synthetase [Methanolinea sp.]HON81312.1 4-phosphopantoate--beta-alanine ligase [Methanoregulaceae archaeon]HPD09824.1 4-phosphopantoate--beta-alanine ligase [Methanoregulaceae archaeon]HRT14455.1 4-phosphopantoate--beta-alanine ligase [Methanoregulaceae archaeon]HRU30026.1 4-phosphopantoate--beta-alanine ligase [Methanoregulaceae archaeon]
MIPGDHPRHRSLATREHLARCAREGIVVLEGLTAHGRGEAFDYLIGEETSPAALRAERIAAALLLSATHPVISVNGNTAALAAGLVADLQDASGAAVEVNLFHRSAGRVERVTRLLEDHGVRVLSGVPERLLPLSHDRALCLKEGIGTADVVLVPLEDGDRCQALRAMKKTVIAIDLNPLSRTARSADLTIVDELTRALPAIARFCRELGREESRALSLGFDNRDLLREAIRDIIRRLEHALD